MWTISLLSVLAICTKYRLLLIYIDGYSHCFAYIKIYYFIWVFLVLFNISTKVMTLFVGQKVIEISFWSEIGETDTVIQSHGVRVSSVVLGDLPLVAWLNRQSADVICKGNWISCLHTLISHFCQSHCDNFSHPRQKCYTHWCVIELRLKWKRAINILQIARRGKGIQIFEMCPLQHWEPWQK